MTRVGGGGPAGAVGVVGLGVVGGALAGAFGEAGVDVRGYDPYRGVGSPRDLSGCSVVFLCVPTPSGPGGSHVLDEIWAAVEAIEHHVDAGAVIAVRSTVPPGTNDRLATAYPRLEFASAPEFLVAARPRESMREPDRLIVGARTHRARCLVAGALARVAPAAPILHVAPIEAELVKLASNAMLAVKVTMANELSEICARYGVEWSQVQQGVGLDRRIGPDHLTVTPERGFGGTCLPKDLDGLIAAARAAGYMPSVLEEVASFNRRIRERAAAPRARPDLRAVPRRSAVR